MRDEQSKCEELSKAIDAINRRQPYHTRDNEVLQLVETAIYVKKYAQSAQEAAITSQLSQRISAEMAARRRKRWFSAIAGVAAAVLLITSLALQQPADNVQLADNNPAILQPASGSDPQMSKPLAQNPVPVPATPQANSPRQAAAVAKPKVKAAASLETQKTVSTDESEPHLEKALTAVKNSPAKPNIVMVWPGRLADTVTNDAGVVRQIYEKNTEREIIITQRPQNNASKQTESDATAAAALAKSAEPGRNKVAHSLNGVEVVVEGKQPPAELEQVAKALVAIEVDKQQAPAKQVSEDKEPENKELENKEPDAIEQD